MRTVNKLQLIATRSFLRHLACAPQLHEAHGISMPNANAMGTTGRTARTANCLMMMIGFVLNSDFTCLAHKTQQKQTCADGCTMRCGAAHHCGRSVSFPATPLLAAHGGARGCLKGRRWQEELLLTEPQDSAGWVTTGSLSSTLRVDGNRQRSTTPQATMPSGMGAGHSACGVDQ